jgi:8-oxo-dGTP diphosphatase
MGIIEKTRAMKASKQDPQSFFVCPNLIILDGQKILLLRRAHWAPVFPGHWHLPTGKIEENESPRQTIIRETWEEVGLATNPKLGTIVYVQTRKFENPELVWKDLSLFFVLHQLDEIPVNKEPRLHDALEWFDVTCLPTPMIPVVKFGIEQYLKGDLYGEFVSTDSCAKNL